MTAWGGWEGNVLQSLHAPLTEANITFLAAWHSCEGGTCRNNPLNTTQPARGASDCNSVGVKNYPNRAVGTSATVQTLVNGHYDGIVRDLRSGNYTAAQILARNRSQISTWGTNPACIESVIGTATAPPPPAAKPPRRAPHTPHTQRRPDPTTSIPGTAEPVNMLTAWENLTHSLSTVLPTAIATVSLISSEMRWALGIPRRHGHRSH